MRMKRQNEDAWLSQRAHGLPLPTPHYRNAWNFWGREDSFGVCAAEGDLAVLSLSPGKLVLKLAEGLYSLGCCAGPPWAARREVPDCFCSPSSKGYVPVLLACPSS